jgi:hypothetical protein
MFSIVTCAARDWGRRLHRCARCLGSRAVPAVALYHPSILGSIPLDRLWRGIHFASLASLSVFAQTVPLASLQRGSETNQYAIELKAGGGQSAAGVAGDKFGPTTKGMRVRFLPKLFGARHRNFGESQVRVLSRLAPQPPWKTQTRSPDFKP